MMYGDGFFAFHLGALLPYLVISLPFAIGFYFVAQRLGRHALLWAVLALIPIVNFFFWVYASFAVVLHILDRLNAQGAPAQPHTHGGS